ncbi:MAG TPA: hypothetical protein DEP84_13950, partial [Chloroflexi bacterium]|nr:hypothetical protein [Chloroflexota bacterium]
VAPIAGAPALPVPVLPDPGKAVRRRYAALLPRPERPGDAEPFIVILDRYGAPAHAARGALDREEIADEILNWVQGLQHECPE